jgi:hypothetical protein
MRKLEDITKEEILAVKEILSKGYEYRCWYDMPSNSDAIEYQLFTKSHAVYSGMKVVEVYEYLKSININIPTK